MKCFSSSSLELQTDPYGKAMKKTWEWLKKGRLKKEMEGMIIAAQDEVLRTNNIKRIIDK